MTHYPQVSPAEIDASIARARQLRSEFISGVAHELTRALVRRYRRRKITRHLRDLPDYLLRDIGIERRQIPLLAAVKLERQPSALARAVKKGLAVIAFTQRAVDSATDEHRKLAA